MSGQRGVILYGPPAAGKDTVARELVARDPRFQQFARLKVGSGRTSGYRMSTAEQLRELRAAGDVVYMNERYGNRYALDKSGLDAAFAAGVPVVHLGQVEGIRALAGGYRADWVVVLLWCPKAVTEQRSKDRGDADTGRRLAAWDDTLADLDAHPGMVWDLTVDTVATAPVVAAALIEELLSKKAGAAPA